MITKNILISLVILSFSFAHIFNYLSYFARISGKSIGYPLVGTSLSKLLEGGSFASLLIFLPSISYLIDKSLIQIKSFIFMFIFCFILCAILMTCVFFLKKNIIETLSKILISHIKHKKNIIVSFFYFWKIDFKYNNYELYKYKFIIHKKILILSIIAFCSLSSGFMISYSLAIYYTDFRLTISSLAMYIHAIGQALLLIFIDPKLNKVIDKMKTKNAYNVAVINTFFCSRIISLILLSLMSLIIILFI
jgi:Na+/melibiose symporter-like transporter